MFRLQPISTTTILLLGGIVGFFAISIFYPLQTIHAQGIIDISGWAWSDTIGWIAFNSTNDMGIPVANSADDAQSPNPEHCCSPGTNFDSTGVQVGREQGRAQFFGWANAGTAMLLRLTTELRTGEDQNYEGESATCRYSTVRGQSFDDMPPQNTFIGTGAYFPPVYYIDLPILANGARYQYYVKCRATDSPQPTNTNDYLIEFGMKNVDGSIPAHPPLRYFGEPIDRLPSGTTEGFIQLSTFTDATCKYSQNPGESYAAMPGTFQAYNSTQITYEIAGNWSTPGTFAAQGKLHKARVTGLIDNNRYTYYVKCSDGINTHTGEDDFLIEFFVGSLDGSQPPIRHDANAERVGFRWTDLEIPAGSTVQKAFIRVASEDTGNDIITDWAFENTAQPTSFSTSNWPFLRWENRTDFQARYFWKREPGEPWYPTRSYAQGGVEVSAGIQELINRFGYLNEIMLLEDGIQGLPGSGHHHWWRAYDSAPERAARLYITYGNEKPYKVSVNANSGSPRLGRFEGGDPNQGVYAWSNRVGWIKFNPQSGYPSSPETVAVSATIDLQGDGSTACGNDSQLYEICGWARACAPVAGADCEGPTQGADVTGGWDGWISLRGKTTGGDTYGLYWDPGTQEIRGFAWGGDVVGWISFSSWNCDPDRDYLTEGGADNTKHPNCPGGQASAQYAVKADLNLSPRATNLRIQDPVGGMSYCGWNTAPVSVMWDFEDDNVNDMQAAFQVMMRSDSTAIACNAAVNTCSAGFANPDPGGGTCEPAIGGNTCSENPFLRFTATGKVSATKGSTLVQGNSSGPDATLFVGDGIKKDMRITLEKETRTVAADPTTQDSLTVTTPFLVDHANVPMEVNKPRWIDCAYLHAEPLGPPPNDNPHLRFDETYYWMVRVRDDDDDFPKWSWWAPFDSVTPNQPSNCVDPDILLSSDFQIVGVDPFRTIRHRAPQPFFDLFPANPVVGQQVTFQDASLCFYDNNYTHTVPCSQQSVSGHSSFPNRYEWDFEFPSGIDCDSGIGSANSCRGNQSYTYTNLEGLKTVLLRISHPGDGDNYCEYTRTFGIDLPFPKWEEVSPFE